MENVLNTVKSKVKTTKILAILGAILIILGLFFDVGSLKFKVNKKEAKKALQDEMGSYASSLGDDYIDKQIESMNKMMDKYKAEDTSMKYWGGPVMLIAGVASLGLAFIGTIKSKLSAETIAKVKFWDKLENIKMIWVPAALVLVILVFTWKTPIKKDLADQTNTEYKEIDDKIKDLQKSYIKAKYSIGAGFVLVFLGAASLIAYPVLYKPEVTDATPAQTVAESKEENA